MTPLSKTIKKLRLQRGLTQEELASLLGVSGQAVSKWETNDTYPDGSLLLPLAEVLGVSLDTLFDNRTVSMTDASQRVLRLFQNTKRENRISLARELCWQIQRGLVLDDAESPTEDPQECTPKKRASFFLGDNGFTLISDGEEPFFSVFEEPQDGFGHFLEDKEALRQLFLVLSEEDTLRALIYLMEQPQGYVFEGEVLERACSIDDRRLADVLNGLSQLKAIKRRALSINGENRTLYYVIASHNLLALFLVAEQLFFHGSYFLKQHTRTRPLICYREARQKES